MKIRKIVPDISSTDLEASKKFYCDFIGLKLAMDMGWILTFISESNPTAQINILQSDKANVDNANFMISLEVTDVDKLYKIAQALNLHIVYPLANEKWGVRRFFVKDPNGVTVNIMCHITDHKPDARV
jgi:catechol 2,3-dioxygenase-like lactoylglutathione lyase family enzyme